MSITDFMYIRNAIFLEAKWFIEFPQFHAVQLLIIVTNSFYPRYLTELCQLMKSNAGLSPTFSGKAAP